MSRPTYELVSEPMSGRRHYRLSRPLKYEEYMPLTDTTVVKETDYFVVSLGRFGDMALFPADEQGRILEFVDLHSHPAWIVDYDEFIGEWIDGLVLGYRGAGDE